MERRFWAIHLKKMGLTLIFVFIIGLLFDRFTNETEYRSPFLAGAISVAIYIILISLLGLFHLMVGAIYLKFFSRNDLVDYALEELRNSRIPPPSLYNSRNQRYLGELVDSESADPKDRVAAAMLLGAYKNAMAVGLFRSLALSRALDAAVLRYSQEQPYRD